jgi:polyhydroxyalkanoate synthesis regulator phasin
MLKGLKGILEKGLQIAAPFIGGALFPGMGSFAAPFATGLASLLTGNKPKDALLSAGGAFLSGAGTEGGFGKSPLAKLLNFGQKGPAQTIVGKKPIGGGTFFSNMNNPNAIKIPGTEQSAFSNIFDTLTKPRGTDEKPLPSFLTQGLSTGIPAYLSYLAAKEDAKKANVPGMDEYMSATDKLYGGQFERPPEERRIQNLTPTYAAAGGMMGREPVNGLKSMEQQPIQYSAMTGQGVMGLAKGGSIDVKELETLMEDGNMSYEEAMDYLKSIQNKAKGGKVFPRRTGAISGPGTKTSDDIPAMLSDGEFVQRTDAVNGAGIMMGAKNASEAREKGADFMYALQDKLAKMGQKVA